MEDEEEQGDEEHWRDEGDQRDEEHWRDEDILHDFVWFEACF